MSDIPVWEKYIPLKKRQREKTNEQNWLARD